MHRFCRNSCANLQIPLNRNRMTRIYTIWFATHRPLIQLGALHITSIYGRNVILGNSIIHSHTLTVTHMLKNNVLLPIPPRFLEDWTLHESGVLKAPVEICARDLIVCQPLA